MTRVALVGLGDISAVHLAALENVPNAELVAVCDLDADRVAAAVAATGATCFTDYVEMLDGARPDVVHVTTPHAEHAPVAIAALERGVHVLTEKPVTESLQAVDALLAAAEDSTANLAVCFQNRYNATSVRMREIIDSGELGAVVGASATVLWNRTPAYYAASPWRGTWAGSGGGLLMNQAIHTIDLLQWLIGPVQHVAGHVATRHLPIEVEDTAEITLTHDGGIRSVFFGTLGNPTNAPVTLTIQLERGSLALGDGLIVTREDGSTEAVTEPVRATGERAYWGASHEALIIDFHAHLDQPFWIDGAEARKSLDVIQRVYDLTYPARIDARSTLERSI